MPWGLTARPYQIEAVEAAKKDNVIVNLPTGTGKTLIAAMVVEALEKHGDGPALIVVPTQALMDQHKKYFQKIRLRAYVNTAAAALQALEDGILPTPHLCVFDEVHHAVKDHPYVGIARFIQSKDTEEKKCRILGLTASFLHGAFSDVNKKRTLLEETVGGSIFVPPSFEQEPERIPQYYRVDFEKLGDLPSEKEVLSWSEIMINPYLYLCPPNLQYAITEEICRSAYSVYCTLGSLGWMMFLRYGLVTLVQQKLRQKAEYVAAKTEFCPPSAEQMEDQIRQLNDLQAALELLPGHGERMSPKMHALIDVCQATDGPGLVFVERKALCIPMKHILTAFGVKSLAVMGVQAMSEGARAMALDMFARSAVDVLITTPSLEEGIDVRVCRFVVRFDYFPTVRSHIQGSGRVRTKDAKIYYFEQDPELEIKRANLVVKAAKGELADEDLIENMPEQTIEGAETIEELGPHVLGAEQTVWDVVTNKSYRGMTCEKCDANVKIISAKFGKGKKKTKRTYVLLRGTPECK